MHLKDVELFCEVADRRSFSRAAEAHSLSQSSASHAVSTLERRLGTQLIDRSKRPLDLTPAGEIYYQGCRDILRSFAAMEQRVRGLEPTISGHLRVAAIHSVGLLEMDTLTRTFHEQCPEVEVHVSYRHPKEVYDALRDGEVELGLVSFPREGGEFGCIRWQEQEMVVATPPGHRLACAQSLPAADLDGTDFVTFDSGLPVRRHIDRWLRSVGAAVNVIHEFDNLENVKRAIEIGAGIGLLPRPTIAREVELGSLAAVPLADAQWTRPLGVVHRRNKTLSAAAERFVALLKSTAAEPLKSAADEPAAVLVASGNPAE